MEGSLPRDLRLRCMMKMPTQLPLLAQLGIYRISSEKQETLIKLLVLSICAILGTFFVVFLRRVSPFSAAVYPFFSIFYQTICCVEIWECYPWIWSVRYLSFLINTHHPDLCHNLGILISEPRNSWPKKVFTVSTTGLMTEHGIPLAGLSVVQSIQVSLFSALPCWPASHSLPLTRSHGHVSFPLSRDAFPQHYHWYSECVCVFGPLIFILHDLDHLSPHTRVEGHWSWPSCRSNDSYSTWLHISFRGGVLWQWSHRNLLYVVYLLLMDQVGEDGLCVLVNPVCTSLFLHGKEWVWLCVSGFTAVLMGWVWLCVSVVQVSSWGGCGYVFLVVQVSSWGGYVFLINLIPMHVLALMVTGRFSHRIYVAYSTVSWVELNKADIFSWTERECPSQGDLLL